MQAMNEISEIDAKYLSTKRVLLSNPGTKLDSVYYTAANTTVELAETTYVSGRYNANLSSLDFGSGSQIVIPNQSLMSSVWLHLELPPIPANTCLPRGWGYAALQSISYLFGSSNIAQLSITGPSIFHVIFGQCETSEKMQEFLRVAGDEVSGPSDPNKNLVADVLLPFPWSTACGGDSTKLPFDTSILANPITLNIQFGPAQALYGGTANTNNRFATASVYLRQGDFSNQSQSLRSVMASVPSLQYGYPLIHSQSYSVGFTGILEPASPYTSISNAAVNINLLGFLNSDLVGVTISIIQQSYLTNGAAPPRPFNYELPKNVQIALNGINVYVSPKQMQKSYNMYSQIGSSAIPNSKYRDAQTVSPFLSDPVNTYVTYVDFSRLRAYSFDKEYPNVRRIGNNTLTMTFNTETTNQYIAFATYHYTAVAEAQAGQTRIYMD